MNDISLENIIHKYVMLSTRPSSKGWWTVKCAVCNDYKKRGGFVFQSDVTTYHCFNCQHKAKHDPYQYGISENMQIVLDRFNVPEDEYKQVVFNSLKLRNDGVSSPTKAVQTDPDTKLVKIKLPDPFILLEDAQDVWGIVAREYLEHDRGVDPSSYPFYILDEVKRDKRFEKKWRGRLIIPYFRNKDLVWYQGRDLRPKSNMRYLNAETESECILSNYEMLHERTDKPIYIVEGFFDAISIDGIAIFGNNLKAGQIKMLERSPRPKVYVPDLSGDGDSGARQALKLGWSVSVPDIGSAKDMNEAVLRYGKLYVLKSLKEFTMSGEHALIRVNLLCKK